MAAALGVAVTATLGGIAAVAMGVQSQGTGGRLIWAIAAAGCFAVAFVTFSFAFWDPGYT